MSDKEALVQVLLGMRHCRIHGHVEVEAADCKHASRQTGGVEDEEHEEPLVVFTHTIVYPPTVVIKLSDTCNTLTCNQQEQGDQQLTNINLTSEKYSTVIKKTSPGQF